LDETCPIKLGKLGEKAQKAFKTTVTLS